MATPFDPTSGHDPNDPMLTSSSQDHGPHQPAGPNQTERKDYFIKIPAYLLYTLLPRRDRRMICGRARLCGPSRRAGDPKEAEEEIKGDLEAVFEIAAIHRLKLVTKDVFLSEREQTLMKQTFANDFVSWMKGLDGTKRYKLDEEYVDDEEHEGYEEDEGPEVSSQELSTTEPRDNDGG